MDSQNQQEHIIIIGVFKAATTSLFTYLSMHPEICASAIKEIEFFTYAPLLPIEKYFEYYNNCSGSHKYHLEASPGYFYGGREVAQRIADNLGENTKIVLLLRDPVSRFVSHFRHAKKFLAISDDLTLEEFIESWRTQKKNVDYNLFPIEGGFYGRYIADWFDVFGDNFKVNFFTEMQADRNGLLLDISQWLDIDYDAFPLEAMHVENQTHGFKNRGLQQVALNVNRVGEQLWRRYPSIKRNLKKAYYVVNGRKIEDSLTEEYHQIMQEIYSPSNEKVSQVLSSRNYANLPDWLKI